MATGLKVVLADKDYSLFELNVGGGAGKRGVVIKGPGLGKDGTSWNIDVNPHDNPDYNNNGQAAFYKAFATKFDKDWPDRPKAVVKVVTLDNAPKELKVKLLAAKLNAQKQMLSKANEAAKATAEETANSAYHKLVVKHLDTRAKKFKVTYGGVEYRCK